MRFGRQRRTRRLLAMAFVGGVIVLALVVGLIYGCGGAATISQEE